MPNCSLTSDRLHAQRDQFIPGLFRRAEKTEDIPNGIRFRFAHKPQLVSDLARLRIAVQIGKESIREF